MKNKFKQILYNFLGSKYYPTFEVGEDSWIKIKDKRGTKIFKARIDRIIINKKGGETPTMYADNSPVHYMKPEQYTINLCVEYKEDGE